MHAGSLESSNKERATLASRVLSRLPKSLHNSIFTVKNMDQLFFNMETTTWALMKHVLFVIKYKVLTMHDEGKQRSLGS